MMKKLKQTLLILSVALTLVVSTGCIALAAGAAVGGYAYYKGELKTTENVSLDRLYNASRQAIAGLQLTTTGESKDGLSGTISAVGANDRKITIKVKRLTDSSSELRIRSGIVGGEDEAKSIRAAVLNNL
jgi:hypothetical protein